MNKGLSTTRLLALSLFSSLTMSGCIVTEGGLGGLLDGSQNDANTSTSGAQGQMPGTNPGAGSGAQDNTVPQPDPQKPCGEGGDIYEDNNSLDKPFALNETSAAAGLLAGASASDVDIFSFSVAKSDPRSVSVRYDVTAMDGAEMALRIFDEQGEIVAEHDETRIDLFENMVASWTPKANKTYRAAVVSDLATCTPYNFKLDATTCTDEYEDNDDPSQAKALSLGYSLVPLATNLTIHPQDPDFFTLEVPTKDPALVIAKHKGSDAEVMLDIVIRDPDGESVGDAKREEGETHTELLTNWVPEVGGQVYQIEVRSSLKELKCNSYDLAIQRCTDSFEDNDRADAAVKLPAGTHEATISDLDKDYYDIPNNGNGGSCVVTYSATTGEDMSMFLFADGKLDPISEHHEDKIADTEVMEVTWGPETKGTLTLWINAADKRCTPYTISCEQGPKKEEPKTDEAKKDEAGKDSKPNTGS